MSRNFLRLTVELLRRQVSLLQILYMLTWPKPVTEHFLMSIGKSIIKLRDRLPLKIITVAAFEDKIFQLEDKISQRRRF